MVLGRKPWYSIEAYCYLSLVIMLIYLFIFNPPPILLAVAVQVTSSPRSTRLRLFNALNMQKSVKTLSWEASCNITNDSLFKDYIIETMHSYSLPM